MTLTWPAQIPPPGAVPRAPTSFRAAISSINSHSVYCHSNMSTMIDSTIAPPQNQRFFFKERFMAARHKERYTIENKVSVYFLVCEGLSIDDVGEGVEGHRISRDTTGSRFWNRRFRSRKVGEATAKRPQCKQRHVALLPSRSIPPSQYCKPMPHALRSLSPIMPRKARTVLVPRFSLPE